jgi:hypothetical protein
VQVAGAAEGQAEIGLDVGRAVGKFGAHLVEFEGARAKPRAKATFKTSPIGIENTLALVVNPVDVGNVPFRPCATPNSASSKTLVVREGRNERFVQRLVR